MYEHNILAKIQDEYKDKKIKFVSISIDNKIDYWTRVVKKSDMEVIQLHADGGWSSPLRKNYQVKSIPTFVMIDASGNIISPYAPRPSSEDIRKLIDDNLIGL